MSLLLPALLSRCFPLGPTSVISLFYLPPYTIHEAQPFDISFFPRPLKNTGQKFIMLFINLLSPN